MQTGTFERMGRFTKQKEVTFIKASTLLAWAASQIGVKESPPGSNNVRYNTDFYGYPVSGSAYPWCCVFVWDGFRECGGSELFYGGGRCAGCTTLMMYHKKQGQFVTGGYKPGDLVLYNYYGGKAPDGGPDADHIGIIESVSTDGTLITIEGNTSVTSNDNGGAVMRRERRSGIIGAIRPAYDEEDDMTQEKFNEMMSVWLNTQDVKPGSDWSEEARDWAVKNGLVVGDGNGNYMWCSFTTREQLVQMLYRLEKGANQ